MGQLTLACDQAGEHLVGLWLKGQKYFGAGLPLIPAGQALPLFELAQQWLDAYFAGRKPGHRALPLAPIGTPFRQAVWQRLLDIPAGQVVTYQDIAQRIAGDRGVPTMSCQAVGGAVGHNPISIIIPCHRVVGRDGSLTGYAGGLRAKRWLLDLEAKQT